MMSEKLTAAAAVAMRWNYRVWGFGEAIALRGLLRAGDVLGDRAPLGFVEGILRSWLGRGVARTNEDHVGAGRELLELYRRTGDSQLLDAARKLAALNESFPVGAHGERYHRGDTPGWRWQIWVDCMDVDGPFLVELAHVTGEDRYFDQAVGELLGYARRLQAGSGLLFHGFERECGPNGELWARGNGWALMGLVDALALLPRTHAAWPELQQRTVALVDALARAQHPTGLWHTVIDDPATYLESTLATMFAYAVREGIKRGVLAAHHAETERKARAAMHAQVAPDGTLQRVSDATPVGARAVYATRPFGTFPWGQGPLLLALCQEIE
jgi:unsaturated rhamnogalacturonyl hydrolase